MASPRVHGHVSKMDTIDAQKAQASQNKATKKRNQMHHRKESKWEILTNLESGTPYNIKPKKMEGLLTKKRKFPMKGWHKRYFILDNGKLSYGKSAAEVNRGRTHGCIDVGTACISAKTESYRIDIDDETFIHHLKAGDLKTFGLWLEQLQQHRFYRQNQINLSNNSEEISSNPSSLPFHSPRGSLPRGVIPNAGPTKNLLQELNQMDDRMTEQMLKIQENSNRLGLLAQKMEDDIPMSTSSKQNKHFFGLRKKKSGSGNQSNNNQNNNGSSTTSTMTSIKSTTASESRSSTLTSLQNQEIRPQSPDIDNEVASSSSGSLATMSSSNLSSSNPSIASTCTTTTMTISRPSTSSSAMEFARPISMPVSKTDTMAVHKDELIQLIEELKNECSVMIRTFSGDKDRLKNAIINAEEQAQMNKTATLGGGGGSNMQHIATLRQTLQQALQQNNILRGKLQKIQMDADISDLPQIPSLGVSDTLIRGLGHQSLSYSSSCISEFFDAQSYGTDDGVASEYSSDEEIVSDNEDNEDDSDDGNYQDAHYSLSTGEFSSDQPVLANETKPDQPTIFDPKSTTLTRMTGRRQKLPSAKPDTSGLNLWNLLCKNIGKDLSKISMPVTLNEPLSVLQRLCEELEYSDLLDNATSSTDSIERMTYVAAFAISAYGYCTARAGHKPFNPLLGETYECIREDKGFRYIAEQVSHHPPVTACHAIGKNWTWSQDFRVKTKFWGKSMEFQPDGMVNLMLVLPDGTKENYTWNKITTCIHNLFSSGVDRWADLYGECQIKCKVQNTQTVTCKLEFQKASGYWTSGKRHEVIGTVQNAKGKVVQHLFGICTEALYCGQAPSTRCIWRPGALPNDSELYYGFSRFAIELNEILESERLFLPKTDTRFRSDQKALEEGQISEAESLKLNLEQAQRERRVQMEEIGQNHIPKWFIKENNANWTFNGNYWDQRQEPGFSNLDLIELW